MEILFSIAHFPTRKVKKKKEQKNKERTDELKTIDEEQGNIFL